MDKNFQRATSVREALELLVGRDPLEGVTSSKTNQEVTAWQQVSIEELPVVLVLHLKCFDYKMEGCTKILKALEFPVELKIDQSKYIDHIMSMRLSDKQLERLSSDIKSELVYWSVGKTFRSKFNFFEHIFEQIGGDFRPFVPLGS